MRTAIAHEWVSARAGSEKVFEALAQHFDEADLYALTRDPAVPLDVGDRGITTTFLDRSDVLRERRNLTLPLMPLAWRWSGRESSYDLVISSSHACVKGFRPGRSALHLCYVHAPMRYAFDPDLDARGAARWAAPARAALRRWDRGSLRWVDSLAANSTEVQRRIRRHYGLESRVIPPPVETRFFAGDTGAARAREGLLAVGRLIPYKRFDQAIRVAHALEEPLTIAGRGPEEHRLRELAASLDADVTFAISPPDEDLRTLYRTRRALLFPGVEDFGIIPVEAQAAGCLVTGPAAGGLLDTVQDGTTGRLARSTDLDDLVDAAAATLRLVSDEGSAAAARHAERFSSQSFRAAVDDWVADCVVGRPS